MIKKRIEYREGYKYQTSRIYGHSCTELANPERALCMGRFLDITPKGYLTVHAGYAFDGPSGPVRDTKYTMRAALVHDALYQLLRKGYLQEGTDRKAADKIFRDICIEDGVSRPMAALMYQGLRWFGARAADPNAKKLIKKAP